MMKIALTGGIGCGKTTVCNLFSQYDVPVIDTDIISRELVEPGKPALLEIVDFFGNEILLDNNSLNRKALAKKIFHDKKNKQVLELILHPKIKHEVQAQLKQLNSCYAIIAIPLLLETNQQQDYDRVLLIDCSEQQQIQRTLSRDQRDLDEIKSIIKSQASSKSRRYIANDIIDNSGNLKSLENKIKKLHAKYLQLCSTN